MAVPDDVRQVGRRDRESPQKAGISGTIGWSIPDYRTIRGIPNRYAKIGLPRS